MEFIEQYDANTPAGNGGEKLAITPAVKTTFRNAWDIPSNAQLDAVETGAASALGSAVAALNATLSGLHFGRIIILGDSHSAAPSSYSGASIWPLRLLKLSQIFRAIPITNLAVNGRTAAAIDASFNADVLPLIVTGPCLVLVFAGTNDIAAGTPSSVGAILESIASKAKAGGATVGWITSPTYFVDDIMRGLNAFMRDAIAATTSNYDFLVDIENIGLRLLPGDRVHLDAPSNLLVAQTVCDAVTGSKLARSPREVRPVSKTQDGVLYMHFAQAGYDIAAYISANSLTISETNKSKMQAALAGLYSVRGRESVRAWFCDSGMNKGSGLLPLALGGYAAVDYGMGAERSGSNWTSAGIRLYGTAWRHGGILPQETFVIVADPDGEAKTLMLGAGAPHGANSPALATISAGAKVRWGLAYSNGSGSTGEGINLAATATPGEKLIICTAANDRMNLLVEGRSMCLGITAPSGHVSEIYVDLNPANAADGIVVRFFARFNVVLTDEEMFFVRGLLMSTVTPNAV